MCCCQVFLRSNTLILITLSTFKNAVGQFLGAVWNKYVISGHVWQLVRQIICAHATDWPQKLQSWMQEICAYIKKMK